MSTESLKFAKFDHSNGSSFQTPEDVLSADLPHGEKHSILEEWKRRVADEHRRDGIDPNGQTLDDAIEKLAGLRT